MAKSRRSISARVLPLLALFGSNGRADDVRSWVKRTLRQRASTSENDPKRDVGRIRSVAMFLAKVCSHNENPDHYAAAICIRVRPDCLLCGYSVGESRRLSVLRKP